MNKLHITLLCALFTTCGMSILAIKYKGVAIVFFSLVIFIIIGLLICENVFVEQQQIENDDDIYV